MSFHETCYVDQLPENISVDDQSYDLKRLLEYPHAYLNQLRTLEHHACNGGRESLISQGVDIALLLATIQKATTPHEYLGSPPIYTDDN